MDCIRSVKDVGVPQSFLLPISCIEERPRVSYMIPSFKIDHTLLPNMSSSMRFVGQLLALSTLISLPIFVSAQESASIFIVNADPQPLVGSIVGTVHLCNRSSRKSCTDQALDRTKPPRLIKSNAWRALTPPSAGSPILLPTSKKAHRASTILWLLGQCMYPACRVKVLPTESCRTEPA